MKVNVKYIHCEQDKRIEETLKEKLYTLGDRYDWIKDGTIYLKIDKEEHGHDKIVEILINTYGTEIYSEGQAKTFELALKKAMHGVNHQIEKNKGKYFEHATSTPL